jgi:1,4-dihydroxy-2-naphthoyl-CoA hydrolase
MKIEKTVVKKAEQIVNPQLDNMSQALGIQFLSLGKDEVKASMPVNSKTVQPMRILHGGASVALAETLMSVGAWLNVDDENKSAVGVEINANHIRPVREGGKVIGTAKPIHRGRQTHVWETRITTEDGKLVCISRCTLAIVNRRQTEL